MGEPLRRSYSFFFLLKKKGGYLSAIRGVPFVIIYDGYGGTIRFRLLWRGRRFNLFFPSGELLRISLSHTYFPVSSHQHLE